MSDDLTISYELRIGTLGWRRRELTGQSRAQADKVALHLSNPAIPVRDILIVDGVGNDITGDVFGW
jgi:hypothetical protein